jgi:hypothetical protein
LGACAPVYTPNALYTPLYTQKGEVHAAAYIGTNGFDALTSYSPSNHFALAAAVSFQSSADSFYSSTRSLGELSIAYYTAKEKAGRIDLIAGIGTGTSRSSIRKEVQEQAFGKGWLKEFGGSFNKYFVQGTVGVPLSTLVSMKAFAETESGITVRTSFVDFYQIDTIDRPTEYLNTVFFEPVFFIRNGWENVKVELQTGVCFPLTQRIAYDWQLFHCAIGFHLTFGKKYLPVGPEPPPSGEPNPVPPYVDVEDNE